MADPRVVVVKDADELGRAGADAVVEAIAASRPSWVAVATGRTPMGMYDELAARRRAGRFDAGAVTAVQLDEYLGLEPGDRRSLLGWMTRSFVKPLGIADERIVRLPVDGDLEAACAIFDRTLEERGGLDLAILGLGHNGHLGFNEPPSGPADGTRQIELTPVTIEANARYWGDGSEVPTTAVTIGMAQLLSARAVVLAVSGASKRAVLRRALDGAIGPDVPASYLREAAGDVTLIVDRAAWGEE